MIHAAEYTQATINYIGAEGPVATPTRIYDGRSAEDLSWQNNGFELLVHPSKVSNWLDQSELQTVYTTEIETLAKDLSGCDYVMFFPPILRSPELALQHQDFAPIQAAHSDYTESYAAMIRNADHPYRQLLKNSQTKAGVTDEQIANCRRILTLQFWRNTGPRRMDYPLALCDANSVTRASMVAVPVDEYGGARTEFESLVLTAGDTTQHQWFTFPDMSSDEVLLFRAFDSERVAEQQPFWTPHCAFADPTVGSDAPGRQSVEMRAICIFV